MAVTLEKPTSLQGFPVFNFNFTNSCQRQTIPKAEQYIFRISSDKKSIEESKKHIDYLQEVIDSFSEDKINIIKVKKAFKIFGEFKQEIDVVLMKINDIIQGGIVTKGDKASQVISNLTKIGKMTGYIINYLSEVIETNSIRNKLKKSRKSYTIEQLKKKYKVA